jgi:hypothetical protein
VPVLPPAPDTTYATPWLDRCCKRIQYKGIRDERRVLQGQDTKGAHEMVNRCDAGGQRGEPLFRTHEVTRCCIRRLGIGWRPGQEAQERSDRVEACVSREWSRSCLTCIV